MQYEYNEADASTIKKQAGQSGIDGNVQRRDKRVEIWVSPQEHATRGEKAIAAGYDNLAQYFRETGLRVFSRRERFYVIVTLKSGRRIGGFYGSESFSSSYPYEEQIFIETVWDIDEEQGFIGTHVRSRGMMIFGADIETIEFIGLYDVDKQAEGNSGDSKRRLAAGPGRLSADKQSGWGIPAAEECSATAAAAGTEEQEIAEQD